jgi:hypothetical protein
VFDWLYLTSWPPTAACLFAFLVKADFALGLGRLAALHDLIEASAIADGNESH